MARAAVTIGVEAEEAAGLDEPLAFGPGPSSAVPPPSGPQAVSPHAAVNATAVATATRAGARGLVAIGAWLTGLDQG